MDMVGRSTNVINETFVLAFLQVLKKLSDEESLAGVILTSVKRTFMAGGDLDWLVKLADAAEAFHAAEKMKALFASLNCLINPLLPRSMAPLWVVAWKLLWPVTTVSPLMMITSSSAFPKSH